MADIVQHRLERMVDELDDMEKLGIFTHSEVMEVVKQRRKFEYRLKRPSPLKQDFLAYIDFEIQLDSLRRLRKKAVARQADKKMMKSVSDVAGVTNIVRIFDMAVTRFKGDINLWFRYLEFCKQRRNGRIKKVLAQVLRFHPKVPGVWAYAAAWEFNHNLNVNLARANMWHGLRVCPNSEDLWLEYLQMELTNLNREKVAIEEDKGTLVRDLKDSNEKQWRDENKESFLSLDEKDGNNEESIVENQEAEKNHEFFRDRESGILRYVYSEAVKALPSSFSLRTRFLEILEATDLVNSEDMRKEVLSDMKKDFSNDPEYWNWLARLEFSDSIRNQEKSKDIKFSKLDKAIQVYEEALESVPSCMMFSMYIKFLMDNIDPRSDDSQVSELSSYTAEYVSHILTVYDKAEKLECMTEDLANNYVLFYMQLGRFTEAQKLSEKLCCGKFSGSEQLWLLRASLEIKHIVKNCGSPSKTDLQSIFELLRNALTKVPTLKAESLWIMALKFFASAKKYFDKLLETSFISVARDGGCDDGFSLSSTITNFVLQRDGVQRAREMYTRFLALPHPGLALYRNCIEMEVNLASVGDEDCLVNARKLYESALATYNQNVTLWQDFYALEAKLGTSETANAVCWRARKTLKDSTAFLASPGLMM